jgi:hypothetical protein
MTIVQRITAAQTAPTTAELLRLAHQYGSAACALRPGAKESGRGPYRFCLLHAIELCLSALLRHNAFDWQALCAMRHDFAHRADVAALFGLKLRKRSVDLLVRLSTEGSYAATRYEADGRGPALHPEQLMDLFIEVAEKVTVLIRAAPLPALDAPKSPAPKPAAPRPAAAKALRQPPASA